MCEGVFWVHLFCCGLRYGASVSKRRRTECHEIVFLWVHWEIWWAVRMLSLSCWAFGYVVFQQNHIHKLGNVWCRVMISLGVYHRQWKYIFRSVNSCNTSNVSSNWSLECIIKGSLYSLATHPWRNKSSFWSEETVLYHV